MITIMTCRCRYQVSNLSHCSETVYSSNPSTHSLTHTRTQLTGASERFVYGADVDAGLWRFAVGRGNHPDDGHLGVELFGPRLGQHASVRVPARPLQEQTVDETPRLGPLGQLRRWLRHHLWRKKRIRRIRTSGGRISIHDSDAVIR